MIPTQDADVTPSNDTPIYSSIPNESQPIHGRGPIANKPKSDENCSSFLDNGSNYLYYYINIIKVY